MYASSVETPGIMLRIVGVAVVLVEVGLKAKLLLKVGKLNLIVLNTTTGSMHSKLGKILRSLLMWSWVCCRSLTLIFML